MLITGQFILCQAAFAAQTNANTLEISEKSVVEALSESQPIALGIKTEGGHNAQSFYIFIDALAFRGRLQYTKMPRFKIIKTIDAIKVHLIGTADTSWTQQAFISTVIYITKNFFDYADGPYLDISRNIYEYISGIFILYHKKFFGRVYTHRFR